MSIISNLTGTALIAVLIQNLVFTGIYGADEALRMAVKPRRLFGFCVMVAYFSVLTAVVCRLLDKIPAIYSMSSALHLAVFAGALTVIYALTAGIVYALLHPPQKFMSMIGMAAINTLVMSVPIINRRAGHGIGQSVATAVGAALAFFIAVLLLHTGMQRQEQNREMPESFKGTPAAFIYFALLSMAFMGFSGGSLF